MSTGSWSSSRSIPSFLRILYLQMTSAFIPHPILLYTLFRKQPGHTHTICFVPSGTSSGIKMHHQFLLPPFRCHQTLRSKPFLCTFIISLVNKLLLLFHFASCWCFFIWVKNIRGNIKCLLTVADRVYVVLS